jgi:hypothetical protein
MKLKSFFVLAAFALALSGLAHAATFEKKPKATLRALDKITGRSTDIQVEVGKPVTFGSLRVELKVCFQTPPEEAPESAAFLKVYSTHAVSEKTMKKAAKAKNDISAAKPVENPLLFSGWMYASSPGLSALEHPVYDIWVIRCQLPPPVKLPDTKTIAEGEETLYDLPGGVVEPRLDDAQTPAAPQ